MSVSSPSLTRKVAEPTAAEVAQALAEAYRSTKAAEPVPAGWATVEDIAAAWGCTSGHASSKLKGMVDVGIAERRRLRGRLAMIYRIKGKQS